MPASPALVEELAPADDAARRLRRALGAVLEESDGEDRAIELVGSRDSRWRTELAGSFAAWGAPDVDVGAGHYLAELVQRYVLGSERRSHIGDVRDRLGEVNPEVLTVVAVDGSAGLTDRAPFALLDGAAEVDAYCRALLGGEDTPAWNEAQLADAGVLDAALWSELAVVDKRSARLVDADATTGVGRYVAAWSV